MEGEVVCAQLSERSKGEGEGATPWRARARARAQAGIVWQVREQPTQQNQAQEKGGSHGRGGGRAHTGGIEEGGAGGILHLTKTPSSPSLSLSSSS